MSMCWNACRQALQQHGASTFDHMWISDEILARAFRRFAFGQGRQGSSVPGPLEARKRLARRRNTELARVGGSGPAIDIGALFGKNDRSQQDRGVNPFAQRFFKREPPTSPAHQHMAPPPYAPNHKSGIGFPQPFPPLENTNPSNLTKLTHIFEERLQQASTLNNINQIVHDLDINLRENPSFSRRIFSCMLATQPRGAKWHIADFHAFLENPSLNVDGAGNFSGLLEYLVLHEGTTPERHDHFSVLSRCLRLGLIPTDEIGTIIKLTPHIKVGTGILGLENPESLAFCYKTLWDGIRTCSILGPKDIGNDLLNLWLSELAEMPPNRGILCLARDLITTIAALDPLGCIWVSDFLVRWIAQSVDPPHPSNGDGSHSNEQLQETLSFVKSILAAFQPRLVSKYVIEVTEFLAFSPIYLNFRPALLTTWTWVLRRLDHSPNLLRSPPWEDLELFSGDTLPYDPVDERFPVRKCLLRLWTVQMLGGEVAYDSEAVHSRIEAFRALLDKFDSLTAESDGVDILTKLYLSMQDFDSLNLPSKNSVLSAAARLEYWKRLGYQKQLPVAVMKTLRSIDTGSTDLPGVFLNYSLYYRSRLVLFPAFEIMSRETNVTGPDFIEQVIYQTETGTSGRSSLLRLLRRHTPLKIALSKSWTARSGPTVPSESMQRPGAKSRPIALDNCQYPDPVACLEVLHTIALIFACSMKVTPRTSWRLTYWCYLFIVQHHGPIKPVMVRILYHAGVQRYRDAKLAIPVPRLNYILERIREVEGADVANALIDSHGEYTSSISFTKQDP